MALVFGKYKSTTFLSDKGAGWVAEIWKKDHADLEADGSTIYYPIISAARNFSSGGAFTLYWNGASNWAFTSDNGGAARHTTGSSDALIYDFDGGAILESGVAYEITIELADVTSSGLQVKLGTAATAIFNSNGVHTEVVTANGTQLSIDPLTAFVGDVKEISLKKYFSPVEDYDLEGQGLSIKWNGSGGTRDRTFLGSECVLNYLVKSDEEEAFLKSTLESGYNAYFIRIYRNGNLFWFGWVQPAFDTIQNVSYPYVYKLTSTDSYGFYGKGDKQYFANETEKTAVHKIKDIYCDFLNDMKVTDGLNGPNPFNEKPVRTNLDWWRPADTYDSANPAVLYGVAKGFVSTPTTLNDDGLDTSNKPFEYLPYDVLNGVLKATNAIGFLADGKYNFFQPNSFINNPSGTIKVYDYLDDAESSSSPSLMLILDDTNNNLLAGSTLTYEPALKKVIANHIGGYSNFSISQGQSLTTEFTAGAIQSTQSGYLTLDFHAKHEEKLTKANFVFNGSGWGLIDNSVYSVGSLVIKITDGSTTKWLQALDGDSELTWSTSAQTIKIFRGYNSNMSNPVNNNTMCVGLVFNNTEPANQFGTSWGPTDVSGSSISSFVTYSTDFRINAVVEDPGISGQVSLEFDVVNDYYQAKATNVGSTPFPSWVWEYDDVNDPTPISSITICENITLIPTEDSTDFDSDVANGIIYAASQNTLNALENVDLGNLQLGQSAINELYSFRYLDGAVWKAVTGFQRGNPSPDNPLNATQLLVNEFLSLQIDPLEILQGTIKSTTISPTQLIRYDYNGDGGYRYYCFLGGTLKAGSDELTGEWFKISSLATSPIIVEDTTAYDPIEENVGEEKPANNSDIITNTILNNSIGVTSTDITHQIAYTKINFGTTLKGKVYDNQKLILTYPDGSKPLILTANGGNAVSESGVDVDSFTAKESYPIGSILSYLTYDFTNVITPIANLYKGVTTTAIYIRPDEFVVPSASSFSMYSRDEMASVQPSSYVSRSHVYATSFIPLNYKVTAVDIYMDQNRGFTIFEGTTGGAGTSSLDTGTANTTLTLSSAWTSIEGKYVILEINFGGTDKIYGAKLTIEAV